jgi:hypothetical protein
MPIFEEVKIDGIDDSFWGNEYIYGKGERQPG